jgi:hypothetical protein
MAEKTMLLTFLLLIIIMQQNVGPIEASRLLNVHPPPTIPKSPQPPSLDYWYSINDDKGGDDAFRPTSPGHSPGVGHQTPPP